MLDTLTGTATIESAEHDFRLRVRLESGKGVIEGVVTTQFADHGGLSFTLSTDQTYLGSTLRQLDSALRR